MGLPVVRGNARMDSKTGLFLGNGNSLELAWYSGNSLDMEAG